MADEKEETKDPEVGGEESTDPTPTPENPDTPDTPTDPEPVNPKPGEDPEKPEIKYEHDFQAEERVMLVNSQLKGRIKALPDEKNVVVALDNGYDVTANHNMLRYIKKEKTVLKGYIARTKSGSLWLYAEEPRRDTSLNTWIGPNRIQLPQDQFPALGYDDTPRSVTITVEDEEETVAEI